MTVAGVSLMPVSTSSVRASPVRTYCAMNRTPRLDSMRWMPGAISISLLSRIGATAFRDRVAAVDADHLAGDARRRGREQPGDDLRHVGRGHQGAERRVAAREIGIETGRHGLEPAGRDDVGANPVGAAFECRNADDGLECDRPGACRAAAGERLRPEERRDGDPTRRAALLRCRQPRLRGEEGLLGPAVDGALELLRAELGKWRQRRIWRKRDETVDVESVAKQIDPERAERACDRMVLRADQERRHQYFPITRPP